MPLTLRVLDAAISAKMDNSRSLRHFGPGPTVACRTLLFKGMSYQQPARFSGDNMLPHLANASRAGTICAKKRNMFSECTIKKYRMVNR